MEKWDFEKSPHGGKPQPTTRILTKIHVLPMYKTLPPSEVVTELRNLMQSKVPLQRNRVIPVAKPSGSCRSSPPLVKTLSNKNQLCDREESGCRVKEGQTRTNCGESWIVVDCNPDCGHLDTTTAIYTGGNPLVPIDKVQFVVVGSIECEDAHNDSVTYFSGAGGSGMNDSVWGEKTESSRLTSEEDPGDQQKSVEFLTKSVSRTTSSNTAGELSSANECKQGASKTHEPPINLEHWVIDPKKKLYRSERKTLKRPITKLDMPDVFSLVLRPYLNSFDSAFSTYEGFSFELGGVTFVVWAMEPRMPGLITRQTKIYLNLDPWGEYREVKIVPFVDTLPRTYSWDIHADYLTPYISQHRWKLYGLGHRFIYKGVEFKVVGAEPLNRYGYSRIGSRTTVRSEGALTPSALDVLPVEVVISIRRLPPEVQSWALLTALNRVDAVSLSRLIAARETGSRGGESALATFEVEIVVGEKKQSTSTAKEIVPVHKHTEAVSKSALLAYLRAYTKIYKGGEPVLKTGAVTITENSEEKYSNHRPFNYCTTECTVCLTEFEDKEVTLSFLCGHTFHHRCAVYWLLTCATCPNCRTPIELEEDLDALLTSDGRHQPGLIEHSAFTTRKDEQVKSKACTYIRTTMTNTAHTSVNNTSSTSPPRGGADRPSMQNNAEHQPPINPSNNRIAGVRPNGNIPLSPLLASLPEYLLQTPNCIVTLSVVSGSPDVPSEV